MKLSLITVLVVALAVVTGCTSSNTTDSASGPVTLNAEAPSEGASVFMRGHGDPGAPNRIVVDVIARGAPDVHGAAFRVTWDPEALTFVEARSGAPWSKQVLSIAKEGTPGQLAVAWTEKGEIGIDATGETVLGTLVFDSRGGKGSPLTFRAERSQIVDKKGARIDIAWRGGTIASR